jgi:hypothetical protein
MNTKAGTTLIIGLFIILYSILLIADGNIVLSIITIDVICMFILGLYFDDDQKVSVVKK